MKPIVIAGYVRSPFHFAKKGALAGVRPDDLAAEVVKALVQRTGADPATIEDLLMGNAFPEAEQGFNIARLVGLMAGLPISVAGATLNRFCGSSMQSIHSAAGAIQMDAGEAFICAGVESMSRVPMTGFNPMPNPAFYKTNPGAYMGMGDTAENVARRWQITRADQEAFAVTSHQKAASAQAAGKFNGEIVGIHVASRRFLAKLGLEVPGGMVNFVGQLALGIVIKPQQSFFHGFYLLDVFWSGCRFMTLPRKRAGCRRPFRCSPGRSL
ncbi:MAG: thiolase family protein [Rhodospirillales bacterium]|nr:thiolase family protein [Rhodospirillales bacterium]